MLSIMSVWLRSMFFRHFTWTEYGIIIATIESGRHTLFYAFLSARNVDREKRTIEVYAIKLGIIHNFVMCCRTTEWVRMSWARTTFSFSEMHSHIPNQHAKHAITVLFIDCDGEEYKYTNSKAIDELWVRTHCTELKMPEKREKSKSDRWAEMKIFGKIEFNIESFCYSTRVWNSGFSRIDSFSNKKISQKTRKHIYHR